MDDSDAERTSRLPQSLLDAWRATRYEVQDGTVSFALQVGEPSAALAACHRRHGARCSAFLTAWNPGGRRAAAAANATALAALARRLRDAGYRHLAGQGADPSGCWPAEASLLVLGIARAEACAIAREFGQAGFLFADEDAVPRLVLLE